MSGCGCGDEALGLPEVTREALVNALAGPGGGPDGVRAIREISRRDLPERRQVLERLVTETPVLNPTKAAAIRALGATPDPEAEAFLVRRLPQAGATEIGQIAHALARTGSTAALAPLSAVTVPEGSREARAVLTARRFIAFRAGQSGAEISRAALPATLPATGSRTAQIRHTAVPSESLERLRPQLQRAVPELDLALEAGVELQCAGAERLLVPRQDLAGAGFIDAARRRPGVAFALLIRDRCIDGLFLESYVLSQPEDDGSVGLYVVRASGDIALAGRADPSDDGAAFRLDALNIRNNPGAATIAGRLDARGVLDLSEALTGLGRAEGQVPQRRPERVEEAPI